MAVILSRSQSNVQTKPHAVPGAPAPCTDHDAAKLRLFQHRPIDRVRSGTIRSEMRSRHMNDYGRLLGRQIEREVPQQKPVDVVEESEPAPASATVPAQPM